MDGIFDGKGVVINTAERCCPQNPDPPACCLQASMIISEGAAKTKLKASEFHFKVQRSWFGGEATEKIEGWKTRIFEAAGKMVAVTTNKVIHHYTDTTSCGAKRFTTWDDAEHESLDSGLLSSSSWLSKANSSVSVA